MKKTTNLFRKWFLSFSKHPIIHTLLIGLLVTVFALLFQVTLKTFIFVLFVILGHQVLVYYLIFYKIIRPLQKSEEQFRFIMNPEVSIIERPIWQNTHRYEAQFIGRGLWSRSFKITELEVTIPFTIIMEPSTNRISQIASIKKILADEDLYEEFIQKNERETLISTRPDRFANWLVEKAKRRNKEKIGLACLSYFEGKLSDQLLREKIFLSLIVEKYSLPHLKVVEVVFDDNISIRHSFRL